MAGRLATAALARGSSEGARGPEGGGGWLTAAARPAAPVGREREAEGGGMGGLSVRGRVEGKEKGEGARARVASRHRWSWRRARVLRRRRLEWRGPGGGGWAADAASSVARGGRRGGGSGQGRARRLGRRGGGRRKGIGLNWFFYFLFSCPYSKQIKLNPINSK